MAYHGDWTAGSTHDFKFSSRNSSGPATLSGTPALSVYKTNSTTQTTTGITLSVDHDGVTGLNHVRIDTSSDGTFYAAGCDFSVVVTTGTVGSVSVVGEVVGSFSIDNRIARANVIQSLGTAVTNSDGTAQAGGSSTITLASGASAVDDYFKYQIIWIVRGTGIGQRRIVTGYVGSTKVATVNRAWATNPDSTSEYVFEPAIEDLAGKVLGGGSGTISGVGVQANTVQVDSSAPAAVALGRGLLGVVVGTVGTSSTSTSIITSSLTPAAAVTDQFKGRIVTFDRNTTTTNLRGQSTDITGSSSGGVLTVTALTTAPVSGDTFTIS